MYIIFYEMKFRVSLSALNISLIDLHVQVGVLRCIGIISAILWR